MLGTTWVKPGTGSTVAEIARAVSLLPEIPERTQRAVVQLERMRPASYRTRLALTGNAPLSSYDLERIESLPDWTKDELL